MKNFSTKFIGIVAVAALAYSTGALTALGSLLTSTTTSSQGAGYGYGYGYSANVTAAQAFERAASVGIVNNVPVAKANLNAPVTREQIAKMMVNYVTKVQKKTIVANPLCNVSKYKDSASFSTEMKGYIKQACDLGIMGFNADKTALLDSFNNTASLDRTQYGTLLSRLLYGDMYAPKANQKFYEGHLAALKTKGIMTKIENPTKITEQRGWVLITLYRMAHQ